jgi:Ser/Thr protein kinase RdoA (MazF antagonist)
LKDRWVGMISRDQALPLFEQCVMSAAAEAYGTSAAALRPFAGFEGCQNLVYAYDDGGVPKVLRVSFRVDRSAAQIRSELDYVGYLAHHGVGVARVVPSVRDALLECFEASGVSFVAVSFLRGEGMRVPDNGYRYRDGAPITEYFRNWGAMLGRMHRLSTAYTPPADIEPRPDLLAMLDFEPIEDRVPAQLPKVRERLAELLDELRALPREGVEYGMIHADFNDGNFTVDYSNGDMTVFDFDDCCYGWFIYELASAWESGVGWAMTRGLAERQAFMESTFAQVLEGYRCEHALSDDGLAQVPLFLRVAQMEELVFSLQSLDDPDEEIQAGIAYKIRCVADGLPYLGFFDAIYNPERPFSL